MGQKLVDAAREIPLDSDVRKVRDLERQLAHAKSTLTGVKARYAQTEHDLAIAHKTIELFTATDGTFTQREQKPPKKKSDGTATAIIVATDWHAEEVVDPATIEGKNEFNLSIAKKRIARLWDKALLLLESERHLSRIDECVLACLGDLMGGHIHEELAETNELTPVEMVAWLQDELAAGIRYIQKHGKFKRLRVVCCSGNHGRDTKKQRISTRESHSYEWLVYHNVARELKGLAEFAIAKGVLSHIEIEGRMIRFTHGDSIKFGGGIGGLTIPATKKVHRWNETHRAYLTFFGHFHQFLPSNLFIACPTLKGYDPFSMWIGAPQEDPSQLFSVIDSRRGLTVAKRIFVD